MLFRRNHFTLQTSKKNFRKSRLNQLICNISYIQIYTNMYEILDSELSLSSEVVVKHNSTNENLSNPIIFIDGNLESCDELLYRSSSSCELMVPEIGSSIDDDLLNESFMKSDSNLVQMSYFLSDSKQKLDDPKSRLFENHELLHTIKNEIQDDIIVEDMAEEEVMSEFLHPYETQSEDILFEVQPEYFNTFNSVPELLSFNSELHVGAFQCYNCNKKFRRKKSLERHIRSHIEFNKSSDKHSENKAPKISKINSHRRVKKTISSATSQICELCGHCADSSYHMKEHLRDHKKFKCLHCDQMFWSHSLVAEHSRLEHGIQCDRFVCFYCGKKCKDLRGLEKHSKVHLDGELLLCNFCGKQFYSRNRLKRHLLSHRDKAVVCEECGEKTTDYRALANHRASHHVISSRNGTLTTRTFPCYACNKVFGSRSSQQIHMRIHTGERPYSCKYCVKAFADGGTLRKHERIHTGEKPYVCPICQKAFNQRVVLREHIRAHHAGPNMAPQKFYKCEVCSTICTSPQDLCSHLVKHSDDNTAKQRTTGNRPRKYRKWKNVDQSSEHDVADDQSSVTVSADSTKLSESLSIGDDSFCNLTDEESFEDVCCGKNDFISPHSTVVEEDETTKTEFRKINRKYSESSCSSDHCSSFIDQMESQKWKIKRREDTFNEVKSFGDPLSFQLLIPFDDKLSDDSVAIRDSSETSGNSYSDTCLNPIEMTDQKSDAYFETSHFVGYAPSKDRLHFSLEEKGHYAFDSDSCADSGLGLGAIVELTSPSGTI